jgi:uncharacterized protein
MKIEGVRLEPPEGFQLIIGQAHFIKSVEDLYETLATSMPGLKFGVAFCEASGRALVRFDGSDPRSIRIARDFALRLGAGHCFVVVLTGAFPINVLNRIKSVEEVACVYCATSNAVTVVMASQGKGRGILGVLDGVSPTKEESNRDKAERRLFLRKTGYKR